jgi:hypothetical protein
MADSCSEDPFVHHILEKEDGSIEPLTPVGKYTAITLRLSRQTLVDFRIERKKLRKALEDLESLVALLGSQEESEYQRCVLSRMRCSLDIFRRDWERRFEDPQTP